MRFDFRRLKTAALCILLGATSFAQTSTQDPLNIFRSLPQDQQDSLIQSILGGGKGNGSSSGSTSSESKDNSSDSSNKDERQSTSTTAKEKKTADGRTLRISDEDPELRPYDYVLLDLTPLDAGANTAVAPAGSSPPPSASGRPGGCSTSACPPGATRSSTTRAGTS